MHRIRPVNHFGPSGSDIAQHNLLVPPSIQGTDLDVVRGDRVTKVPELMGGTVISMAPRLHPNGSEIDVQWDTGFSQMNAVLDNRNIWAGDPSQVLPYLHSGVRRVTSRSNPVKQHPDYGKVPFKTKDLQKCEPEEIMRGECERTAGAAVDLSMIEGTLSDLIGKNLSQLGNLSKEDILGHLGQWIEQAGGHVAAPSARRLIQVAQGLNRDRLLSYLANVALKGSWLGVISSLAVPGTRIKLARLGEATVLDMDLDGNVKLAFGKERRTFNIEFLLRQGFTAVADDSSDNGDSASQFSVGDRVLVLDAPPHVPLKGQPAVVVDVDEEYGLVVVRGTRFPRDEIEYAVPFASVRKASKTAAFTKQALLSRSDEEWQLAYEILIERGFTDEELEGKDIIQMINDEDSEHRFQGIQEQEVIDKAEAAARRPKKAGRFGYSIPGVEFVLILDADGSVTFQLPGAAVSGLSKKDVVAYMTQNYGDDYADPSVWRGASFYGLIDELFDFLSPHADLTAELESDFDIDSAEVFAEYFASVDDTDVDFDEDEDEDLEVEGSRKEALTDFPSALQIQQVIDSESKPTDAGFEAFVRKFIDRGRKWFQELLWRLSNMGENELVQGIRAAMRLPVFAPALASRRKHAVALQPNTRYRIKNPGSGREDTGRTVSEPYYGNKELQPGAFWFKRDDGGKVIITPADVLEQLTTMPTTESPNT